MNDVSGDVMEFPDSWEQFLDSYSFRDTDEVYTNGSELVQRFRVEQMVEHYFDDTPVEDVDTREKLEADVRAAVAYTTSTLMYPSSANQVTEHIKTTPQEVFGWLDRQAALTEREVEHDLMKAGRMAVEVERERIAELQAERDEWFSNAEVGFKRIKELEAEYNGMRAKAYALEREVEELQKQLGEYDETHMPLPVDADGEPIRVDDVVEGELLDDTTVRGTVCAFRLCDNEPDSVYVHVNVGGGGWTIKELRLTRCRHVQPKPTVEDVLREFAGELKSDRTDAWDSRVDRLLPEYADKVREAVG